MSSIVQDNKEEHAKCFLEKILQVGEKLLIYTSWEQGQTRTTIQSDGDWTLNNKSELDGSEEEVEISKHG